MQIHDSVYVFIRKAPFTTECQRALKATCGLQARRSVAQPHFSTPVQVGLIATAAGKRAVMEWRSLRMS